jgi:hypothetical protein
MLHTLTGTLLEVHRYVNAHHYHQRLSGAKKALPDPDVQTKGNAVIVRGLYNRTTVP